jgi:hypothetical protein
MAFINSSLISLNLLVVARTPKTGLRPKTGSGPQKPARDPKNRPKTPKRGVKLKSEKNAFLGKNPHVGLE